MNLAIVHPSSRAIYNELFASKSRNALEKILTLEIMMSYNIKQFYKPHPIHTKTKINK